MPDKPPSNNNSPSKLLKNLWAPIASFISAVTSAYALYQLWLGDQGTVTCFFAGGGLLVLVITLVWVGFSKKTITLKPDRPMGPSKKERVPRYLLWVRIVAWISIVIIMFISIVFGRNCFVQAPALAATLTATPDIFPLEANVEFMITGDFTGRIPAGKTITLRKGDIVRIKVDIKNEDGAEYDHELSYEFYYYANRESFEGEDILYKASEEDTIIVKVTDKITNDVKIWNLRVEIK